ncbi:SecY-interacting protein Syd [Paenibacillus hubeiensis]|uniref:SecY-interacting protein Syd n=1 Tax=Paenibacillus hubeiensis TaxID=3077330 RepID=UPI0031BB47EF
MIKKSMEQYFERFISMWKEFNGTLPRISWFGEDGLRLYVGEKDNEGYIEWLPTMKNDITNFDAVEELFTMKLHEDIKQYYNAYYFFQIAGWVEGYNINLNPVLPKVEPETFVQRFSNYITAHDGRTTYVPIGMESNGLIVVLDNMSGEVYLEDNEVEKFIPLKCTLEEMIQHLSFRN